MRWQAKVHRELGAAWWGRQPGRQTDSRSLGGPFCSEGVWESKVGAEEGSSDTWVGGSQAGARHGRVGAARGCKGAGL